MKLEIVWHSAAERDLLDLHWRRGELIDRAVLRFADDGVGNLRRVESSGRLEYIAARKRSARIPSRSRSAGGIGARDDATPAASPSFDVRGGLAARDVRASYRYDVA
jgi:hypothetical protein